MSPAEPLWHAVGPVEQFTPEGITAVQLDGEPVAVYRTGGRFYASPDNCPHRNAPLTRLGRLEDGQVVCTWHGWRFNLADGNHPLIPGACIKMLPTQVIQGELQLDLRPLRPQHDPWGF